MPKVVHWSLGFVLAAILAFVPGASPVAAQAESGSAPPASCAPPDSSTPGANGYTAPAPCKIDASGTDNDQYCIPLDAFHHPVYGFGGYWVNGKLKGEGCYSTNGEQSIMVSTDPDAGSWILDYTDEDQGKEAKNLYGADLGECNPDVGRWSVTAWVTNQDDDTNLPIDTVEVFPNRPSNSIPIPVSGMYDIQDGETRQIAIADYPGGLPPGTWHLDFYRDHHYKKTVGQVVLWVPACGDESPPAGDHPPTQEVHPKATIRQLVCQSPKVRLTFNNSQSDNAVTFRVVKNGKLVKKPYRLKAGMTMRVTKKARAGSVVKVKAAGKVLAAKRIKPYRRDC